MAERVKQEPRPAAKKAEEQIKLDMQFETGERLVQPGGQVTGERAGRKFAPGLDKREEGQSETPKKHETE
ncbi:hypothetical protein CLOM_g7261 [Closterium sp. NIES-68]|nr:hypothetical protein CLOM_g7261 [Closterium sp. NIES-68]GJP75961.1 hypothetical protein CLOP_g6359 [Closterium sp. NIES-67]